MKERYVLLYEWENLEDGTIEKFNGRINSLAFEISLRNKLGCPDITMPGYLPLDMYDKEMELKYELAKIEYNKRKDKLLILTELIKTSINHDKKIDDEYLYELWISRIFALNWTDESHNLIKDIDILIEELSKKVILIHMK